jgi:cytidine deaminase
LFSGSGRNNRNGLPEKTDFSDEDARYMRMAIDLSVENIDNGGGPFGAVIVRDGEVIATGVNRVVPNNDPTAHAEVNAIRNACQKLDTFQLEGCTVYSSCEPCPMCLSALYWAGVKHSSANSKVKLLDYFLTLTSGLKPVATLKISVNGKEYEETSSGDGQYDAFMRALRKVYKNTLGRKFPMLINYAVSIPPGGRTDAFVQTIITWKNNDRVFRTKGLDADQTEAAIKATVKMLNIIEEEY